MNFKNKFKGFYEKFYKSVAYYLILALIIFGNILSFYNIFFAYKYSYPSLLFLFISLFLSLALYIDVYIYFYTIISIFLILPFTLAITTGFTSYSDMFLTWGIFSILVILSIIFGTITYHIKKDVKNTKTKAK